MRRLKRKTLNFKKLSLLFIGCITSSWSLPSKTCTLGILVTFHFSSSSLSYCVIWQTLHYAFCPPDQRGGCLWKIFFFEPPVWQNQIVIWEIFQTASFVGGLRKELNVNRAQQHFFKLSLFSTGKIWVCQAQRNPWRCDAGERFSSVGEEPAPRQTGEPRAGAQGKRMHSEGKYYFCTPQTNVSKLSCFFLLSLFGVFICHN